MSVLHTHVNVSHVCAGALGGQKGVLDPLKPKWQVSVITMLWLRVDPNGKPAHGFGYEGKKKQEHMDNTC